MNNKIQVLLNSNAKVYSGYGLKIRIMRKDDIPSVVKWRNDNRVKKFMGNTESQNLITMKFWFNKITREHSCLPFIIENNEESIGFLELKNFEVYGPHSCEQGIFLNPDYIGKGLMKSINFVLEEILSELEINDLIGVIRKDNFRNRHIWEKTGAELIKEDNEFCTYISRKEARRNNLVNSL